MTEQYKINPEGFRKIQKQVLSKNLPLGIMAIAVGIGIAFFNPNMQENSTSVLPILIPVLIGVLIFGTYRGIRRQNLILGSYLLTISEDEIARSQSNTSTISIALGDIREISKNSNGSFTIRGSTPHDVIGIPAQVENYEHLEATLQQIKPITVQATPSFDQKLQIPAALATMALMATVFIATNKILVGICGTILSGFLIWSFIKIQQNKSIDQKTKKSSYWTILVLISIILITLVKLTR